MSSQESDANLGTQEAPKSLSKSYFLEKLVSDGPITHSWIAINSNSKRRCFVKVSKTSASIDDDAISSFLQTSYGLQKLIRSNGILRAYRKSSENRRLFIEYPYLDQNDWQVLTPGLFGQYFGIVFPAICKIVDYLHLLGLVHCDLKLENFLINTSNDNPKIILMDLDYLTKAHSHPDSRIFGSFEHIAPEIRENNIVLVQSDNYSLGQALKRFLLDPQFEANASPKYSDINLDNVLRFADELVLSDYSLRPKFLIEALLKHQIINLSEYQAMEKSLFVMKLLSDFRHGRHEGIIGNIVSWQNAVFGFPDELAEELEKMYWPRPLQTFRILGYLIENASLNQYDGNWQIAIDDKELIRAFEEIEVVIRHNELQLFGMFSSTQSSMNDFCVDLLKFSNNHISLKIFLALKRILNLSDKDYCQLDNMVRTKILIKLGDLAQILGRPEEAIKYLSDSLANAKINGKDRCRIIYDISYNFLLSGRLEECEKWLQNGRLLCQHTDDKRSYLAFLRQEAWLFISRGRFEEAEERLSCLTKKATQSDCIDELGKLLVALGVLFWRKGEYTKAEENLIESFVNLEKTGARFDQISPLSNLSLLYYELAEYRKAISYGEKAAKIAEELSQASRLPAICINLMISYSRLGEYKKANDWLQKYLAGKSQKHDAIFFRNFYFYQGNLFLRQNQLRQAKDALHQALLMYGSGDRDRLLGKLYHSVALIALYQGDKSQFDECQLKAKDVYTGFNDNASLAELGFLGNLETLYYSPEKSVLPLLLDLEHLIKYNCRYYVALCLFHILLYADEDTKNKVISKNKFLVHFVAQSDVPLFQAVSALNDSNVAFSRDKLKSLTYLKSAYRQLFVSGDCFFALLICEEIAEVYQSIDQTKLARKFLLQAHKLAENLGNASLADSIGKKIQSLPIKSFDRAQMLESFKRISEILGNISDFETSLARLVEFSIHETGAERGVLLLHSEEQSNLVVKAIVNCNPECLDDIRHFSQSICNRVSQNMSPLIIDNAKEDDRTKKYKSIIAFNILSVICLPIKIDEKPAGVLYLDHHTIPALFESDDITFVYSIANFISILLSTIKNQKYQIETKRQLIDDLARLRGGQKFVTQNETMNQLFSRLPEMALHNVSILLMGESGTGKEILAQMIHDLSSRAKGPLVKLNCAAIVGSLIESELFGVAKNVATGVDEREGKLFAADGGTLFLDEIGDMPLEVQSKILRVLEYQHFEKVGSNRTISTDIRFIYATNKDLKALITQGKFREDLYFRINTITIHIPPLRERIDDIPLLLEHFLSTFIPDKARSPVFSSSAVEALMTYPWPGNVRELRNLAEKFCLLYSGKQVNLIDLPSEFREKVDLDSNSKRLLENMEKAKIRKLLLSANWNQSEVSRITGIPLSTLRRKIKKYKILKSL
jgi:Nif-specific regulatory protein